MNRPVKIEGCSERGPVLGFLYPPGLQQPVLVCRATYMGETVRLTLVERDMLEEQIRARYGGMFS